MNWEYEYNRLVNNAVKLNEMYKRKVKENEEYKERIDKAIEILDIYGTSNYETADMLYKALRGDKE